MSHDFPDIEPTIEVIHDDRVEHITRDEAQARILSRVFTTAKMGEETHEALQLIINRQKELYVLQDEQARRSTAMTAVGLILLGGACVVSARAALRAEEKTEEIGRLLLATRKELGEVADQVQKNGRFIVAADTRVRDGFGVLTGLGAPKH